MDSASGIGLLGPEDMHHYMDHLQRLDAKTRRRRFGHTIDNAAIQAHCLKLVGEGAQVVALSIDGLVRGAAEISPPNEADDGAREIAFSVEADFQGCGIGTCLALKAVSIARPSPVTMICSADNNGMIALGWRIGARFHKSGDHLECRIDTERRAHSRDGFTDADGLQPAIFALARGYV